ncbi:hypothetical protein K7432_010667 [Basidiobolus ranarum]|uniref:Uncharacterized protein n=1 Tax=Basidiobolus ranarum TaxID=34480 RepID=A0ABR2WNI7_9FUNG
MHFSNIVIGAILATLSAVSAVPSIPCNQNSGASYYCEGSSFFVCQTSTSKWLLQNTCVGDCCDTPAYAAFCPNCDSQPTTSKTTTSASTKTTASSSITKSTVPVTVTPTKSTATTKPTTKSTKTVPPSTTTTTSDKPDATVAPGADCLVNGRYGCAGSYFLVCQNGKWAVQNNCGGTCCSMFQYAQYCYNC